MQRWRQYKHSVTKNTDRRDPSPPGSDMLKLKLMLGFWLASLTRRLKNNFYL
ncbi:hypothetical protein [Methylophilus sp.]|uniref:hypothetical protein n=1 Tax=Methylophilus sp. TaxID=29541 RepID=UPI0040364933